MKRLFLLAGVVAAMISCSENSVSDVNSVNSDVFTIADAHTSSYIDPATKGTVTDQDSVEDSESGFGIMAYKTGNGSWDNDGSFIPNYMYNQQATYSQRGWSYSPVKYWPNGEGEKISFFTYAPYSTDDNGVNAEYSGSNAGLPQIEFTVSDEAADMVDFMAGQNIDVTRQQDGVDFGMKHQLARVTFSAKTTTNTSKTEYVVVTSLDIVDSPEFYTNGIYTFANTTTNNNSADHSQNGEWVVSEPLAADYSLSSVLNNEVVYINGYMNDGVLLWVPQDKYTSLFAEGEYLFLLPPSADEGMSKDGVKVRVNYDIVTLDDQVAKGYTVTVSSQTVSLPAGSLKQGKAYNFQLNIDVSEIIEDPAPTLVLAYLDANDEICIWNEEDVIEMPTDIYADFFVLWRDPVDLDVYSKPESAEITTEFLDGTPKFECSAWNSDDSTMRLTSGQEGGEGGYITITDNLGNELKYRVKVKEPHHIE